MKNGRKPAKVFRKHYLFKALSISTLVFIFLAGSMTLVQSATVSGTVYEDDGTPITGTLIHVGAYAGDPCGTFVHFIVGYFNSTDGTFVVEVPAGEYYLLAHEELDGNYLLEWWTPGGSTPKCADAVPIPLTVESKDFQLSIAQPGDVNRDGDISLYDAIITLQNLTGQTGNRVWLSGDVNNDDRISIPEAIYILKASAQ